jgi:uncharacterized protein (TIGR02246 family)
VPVVDMATEQEAVLQFARDFAAAEASNDDDAVMAFWWDDAVMQPPNAPTIQGAEAIRAMYEMVTFESMEVGELTARVSGDLAVVWGPFMATVVIEGVGRMVNDNKFIVVLERRDGVWKAIENSWNSNLPPTAPPSVEE